MIWTSELLHPYEYSIMLGRAHYGHALRLPVEEHAHHVRAASHREERPAG